MSTPTTLERWGELTPELKLECIKGMGFLEKYRLRTTSQTDRAVVSMSKFDIKQVSITDTNYGPILELNVDDKEKYKLFAEEDNIRKEQLVPLLAFVLKCGNIDEIILKDPTEYSEEEGELLRKVAPFHVKKIAYKPPFAGPKQIILENALPDSISDISFGEYENESFNPLFGMPSLNKIEKLNAGSNTRIYMRLAEKWIQDEEGIGRKLYVIGRSFEQMFVDFANHFRDRVVDRQDSEVRITTDNAEKHIILFKKTLRRIIMAVMPASLERGTQEYNDFIENCQIMPT